MPPQKRKIDDAEVGMGGDRPAKHLEPSQLLSRVRGEVANDLRPSIGAVVSNDVEQNIREIRAIIITNDEIFDRCMGSRKQDSHTTFERFSFDLVEARTMIPTIFNSTIQFVTYPKRLEKSFDMTPLAELPASIANIFVLQKKSFADFIDYEALFEKSLILHGEVLGAFLEQLKDHLVSSVQVCLGRIETWLMEKESNISYLESKFDVNIEFPEEDDPLKGRVCSCPTGTHPDSLGCLWCGKQKCDHFGPSETWCYKDGKRNRRFRCKKFNLLNNWTTALPGTIDLKFDVSKENDRRRLEKVLELMKID